MIKRDDNNRHRRSTGDIHRHDNREEKPTIGDARHRRHVNNKDQHQQQNDEQQQEHGQGQKDWPGQQQGARTEFHKKLKKIPPKGRDSSVSRPTSPTSFANSTPYDENSNKLQRGRQGKARGQQQRRRDGTRTTRTKVRSFPGSARPIWRSSTGGTGGTGTAPPTNALTVTATATTEATVPYRTVPYFH